MSNKRIILANESRLLREMLNRIFHKSKHLHVVQQISGLENLTDAIQQQNAEWIILTLPEDNKIPDWTDSYMAKHPFVKILTVSPDGSSIKMKWLAKHEQDYSDLSLQDLIQMLEEDSNIEQVGV